MQSKIDLERITIKCISKKEKRKGKIDMNNENGKLSLAEKMKEKADKMNEHPIVLSGNENEIANWCYKGIIKEVDKVAGYGCYSLRLWPLIPKEIREKIELDKIDDISKQLEVQQRIFNKVVKKLKKDGFRYYEEKILYAWSETEGYNVPYIQW